MDEDDWYYAAYDITELVCIPGANLEDLACEDTAGCDEYMDG